ncbi:13618_t:CDS:1, partial [Cetraspora pellucida]
DEQLESDEDEEEIQSNWIILAEIGPNVIVDSFSGLGLSNTNKNHNWIGDVRRHYSNINLADMNTFVQQVYNKDVITAENLVTNVIFNQKFSFLHH